MTTEGWVVVIGVLAALFQAGLYLYVANTKSKLRDRQETFEEKVEERIVRCSQRHDDGMSREFGHVNGELKALSEAVAALREMAAGRFAAIETKLDVLFKERQQGG